VKNHVEDVTDDLCRLVVPIACLDDSESSFDVRIAGGISRHIFEQFKLEMNKNLSKNFPVSLLTGAFARRRR
jgi:hypothetical protein